MQESQRFIYKHTWVMYEHYDQSSSCTEIDIEIVSAKTFELCLPIYHIKQAYD